MPLVSAPNRGYPDYQRISNYDTGILGSYNIVGSLAQQWIPGPGPAQVLDISRYAYLGIHAGVSLNPSLISVQWYADTLANVPVGARSFTIGPNMLTNADIRLANLGPFFNLLSNPPLGARNELMDVFASNRVAPLETASYAPVLISNQNTAIGASSSITISPINYYAGPARMWWATTFGPFSFTLQRLTGAGTFDAIDSYVGPAAIGSQADIITPLGAWNIQVTNSSAAPGNFYLAVTPSLTGAT